MSRAISILLFILAVSAQPALLFSPADRDRILDLAAQQPWAAGLRNAILRTANNWPQSHLARFGLRQLEIPAEGGQWWHHYVCPTQGVRLEFRPPATHRCPVETAGGRPSGRWYFDDLTLVYGDETHLAAGFEDAFRSLKVHMLATDGTTVITGQGLGPDLRVPVPYVVARRQAPFRGASRTLPIRLPSNQLH